MYKRPEVIEFLSIVFMSEGAVYQAAELGKGFKVKKFVVKDANVYPIQVCECNFLTR